jgi:hypothetical protein
MRAIRAALLLLLGFVVLAALRGAVAVLGAGDAIPTEWLGREPARVFGLPALALFAVGASALVSLAALAMRSARGPFAAMVPGALLIASVAAELLAPGRDSNVSAPIGLGYVALGGGLIALALPLRRSSPHARVKQA